MKALVCGGRDFCDRGGVFSYLDSIHRIMPITKVIHGGARGADFLAGEWANYMCIPCTVYKANWEQYGKAAGHIRNQQMLDDGKPDVVIAFPGGKGTENMMMLAKKANVHVHEAIIVYK